MLLIICKVGNNRKKIIHNFYVRSLNLTVHPIELFNQLHIDLFMIVN